MTRLFGFAAALAAVVVFAAVVRGQEPAPQNRLPSMSYKRHLYYQQHPEEFQQLIERLQKPAQNAHPDAARAVTPSLTSGTWTSLVNQPPIPLMNPLLLTDGTVIAHGSCSRTWYKLTPDNTGNYVNGTWTPLASTAVGYAPRFFGSGVLPDGRVVTVGGEYNGINCANNSATTKGAIYDPVANTWTAINPPAGWVTIADAAGIVLPNGSYMQTSCCDGPDNAGAPAGPHAAILDPTSLTWTNTGTGKNDVYDEESMALLHDDTVLTVDAYVFRETHCTDKNSERYNPTTGAWTTAGPTPTAQSDCTGNESDEVGPLVMRPNGTAVSFSGVTTGTPQTSIYNVGTHTWAAGPMHPSVPPAPGCMPCTPYTMADAPAAVLPNGNILVAMSPSNWPAADTFPGPTHYWELNIADNTFTQVADKADVADDFGAFEHNMLVLPTGQIIDFTIDPPFPNPTGKPSVQIYTANPANGTYQQAWRPAITAIPQVLNQGATYTASGTQFNGLSEGAYYGDDVNGSSHFPLVRITNNASGHVFYARTFNHANRSIAPGRASSTSFTVPASAELGPSQVEVVANGIPSPPMSILVTTANAALQVSPATNIVASGNQGGPFTPGSFNYSLTDNGGPIDYTITGLPSWLTASSTSGITPATVTFTINATANSLSPGTQSAVISFGSSGAGATTRTADLTVLGSAATSILASVLPNARDTTIGQVVTAFATIINTGPVTATGCFIGPPSNLAGTFLYQTTDPATNRLSGTANTPVDIAAGQPQSFFFAVTPSVAGTQDLALIFGCTNAQPPATVAGLNTFLLSTGATPLPDLLSIASTATNDGNIVVNGPTGIGFMATAAVNIGASATVTFKPTDTPFGQQARNLPVTLTICQTDSNAQCLAAPSTSVDVVAATNQIFTFAVFVQGQGTFVPYDPANNRIFLVASQGSTPVGETGAALKMVP